MGNSVDKKKLPADLGKFDCQGNRRGIDFIILFYYYLH